MTTPPPSGRTLARGIATVGIFRWSSQVVTWVITLIVLRILSPRDYGVLGMTAFFMGLAGVFSEFGIGTAVVALRELSDAAIRQLHSLAILISIGAAFLAAVMAWPMSRYYREPALIPALATFGVMFIFEGLRVVPLAMLSRALEYRKTAGAELLKATASGVTVLILALSGFGYWALIGGALAGSAIASLWVLSWRSIAWEWPTATTLAVPIRYCRHLLVGRLAWQSYQNADFLVAGRLFGTVLLGQYNVAWTIASLPGAKLANVITSAITPFFAAIQNQTERLASYFLRITSVLSLVLWPVLFGFLAVADLAIPVIMGAKWTPAVPIARALVLYAALQSVTTLNDTILYLTGQSGTAMRLSLLALAVLPPAFYLGGRLGGVVGVALAWLLFPILNALSLRLVLRTLHLSVWPYLGSMRRSALMVGVMLLCVWVVRLGLNGRVGAGVELLIAILAGAVVYGLLCLRFVREDIVQAFRTWQG